jgi:hypothetical protein
MSKTFDVIIKKLQKRRYENEVNLFFLFVVGFAFYAAFIITLS